MKGYLLDLPTGPLLLNTCPPGTDPTAPPEPEWTVTEALTAPLAVRGSG